MQIKDSFRVDRPIETTWETLLDIERIAPALPGAELQEVEGDEFRGVVKVKVGPITAQYKGSATLAEVDEETRRVVIDASGRDSRGQGNAKATIGVAMSPDGDATRVEIDSDVQITGKVAQFARGGVLEEVSSKLLGQFAQNLERDILGSGLDSSEGEAHDTDSTPGIAPARPEAGPRPVASAPAEPVDLLELAGAPVARRVVPIVVGILVMILVWRLLRGGRRRRD